MTLQSGAPHLIKGSPKWAGRSFVPAASPYRSSIRAISAVPRKDRDIYLSALKNSAFWTLARAKVLRRADPIAIDATGNLVEHFIKSISQGGTMKMATKKSKKTTTKKTTKKSLKKK